MPDDFQALPPPVPPTPPPVPEDRYEQISFRKPEKAVPGWRLAVAAVGVMLITTLALGLIWHQTTPSPAMPTATWKPAPLLPQSQPEVARVAYTEAELAKAIPDLVLTPNQVLSDYLLNRTVVQDKYEGHIVEISGVVREVERNYSGERESLVFLHCGEETTLHLGLVTLEKEPWARISPGQKVKARGIPRYHWAGPYCIGVFLFNCVFTELGPNPAMNLSAVELSREFFTDKNAAEKKYNLKYLVITGDIIDKTVDRSSDGRLELNTHIFLRGDNGRRVECDFRYNQADVTKTLEAGQRIKLFGRCGSLQRLERGDAFLWNCLLIAGQN
jgi:hypothetical protein